MSGHPAFELIREETIPEVSSEAKLYRHKKTGAEVLSLANDDENKVFGITFKTPPEDSTGVAHILEHSVLCGSRKYPVKKPFVELLKGSLHTFLNAMTFADKTAYPVASQNLQDFYNLVDVYLDAVFFPLITEDTFRQEGWHYELDSTQGPMVYKGVVFNEMKGAYSSAAAVLSKKSQLSLYPDTTYGVNSGGDPAAIPNLTYEYFKDFHSKYYHPSNARIVFYGDDDPDERLSILDGYLGQFDRIEVKSQIGLQRRWSEPKKIVETYAASEAEAGKKTSMMTVNWMLDEQTEPGAVLALNVLEYILVGTAASPLRKALIDSGLGEGMTGSGIVEDMKQPYFTVGLKGIDDKDADVVETLILATLERLASEGIDKETIEAAVNSIEFAMRENNTGSFPRGISLMFRSMRTWLLVGLGNPGPPYAAHRHNAGYRVVDALAAQAGARFSHSLRLSSDVCRTRITPSGQLGGVATQADAVVLLKSRTYMNDSGRAVAKAVKYFDVQPDFLVAIHDEIDLEPGQLRVKFGGGDNGHNGLKSIRRSLGTGDYYRVRIGVGRPTGSQPPADYLLSPVSPSQREGYEVDLARAADAVVSLLTDGLELTQSRFNS